MTRDPSPCLCAISHLPPSASRQDSHFSLPRLLSLGAKSAPHLPTPSNSSAKDHARHTSHTSLEGKSGPQIESKVFLPLSTPVINCRSRVSSLQCFLHTCAHAQLSYTRMLTHAFACLYLHNYTDTLAHSHSHRLSHSLAQTSSCHISFVSGGGF